MTRLTRWLSGPTSSRRPATPRRTLRLESLEGREVPAVITVTSLADNLDVDGLVTLREAIQAANSDSTVGDATGDGFDTIVFDPSLSGGTVNLFLGELALTDDHRTTTVDGGGGITVDARGSSRVFNVGQYVQATLRGLTITGGLTSGNGGGVYNNGGGVVLDRVTVSGSLGQFGGGVYNDGSMRITASTITSNGAFTGGGGIYNESDAYLTVMDSVLTGNTADLNGGGLFVDDGGTATVARTTLFGNRAEEGGGVYVKSDGTLTLTESTVSGNSANSNGGGVYNQYNATLTITESTLVGNRAIHDNGGGVYNDGSLMVTRSTLVGNSANVEGGGVYNGGTAMVDRSTLVGNSANVEGGGVYNGGTAMVDRSTLVGNSANVEGGGVYNGNTISLWDTLLLGNAGDDDLSNHSTTSWNGGSLIGLNGYTLGQILAVSAGEPLLADNGGPTQTVALVAGSPALGIASPVDAGASPDQRGYGYQFAQAATDAGAFQFSAIAPETGSLIVDITDDITNAFDGLTSLREAVNYANTLTGSRIVTFDSPLANSTFFLNSGELEFSSTDGVTTVDGGGGVTVSGDSKSRVFDVQEGSSVVLRGLTITGGSNSGVVNRGTLTIDQSTISGNTAINGGGIFNGSYGILTITHSTISGNTADNGGGIHNNNVLSIIDSLIDGNTSTYLGGGGVWSQNADLTLLRSTLSNNTSTNGGGVFIQDGGTATITDSTFSNNTADSPSFGGWGGGMRIDPHGTVTITRSTFTGNTARYGGGVDSDGDLLITDSTFNGNTATLDGGGVYNGYYLTLTRSTFVGNFAVYGGGVLTNYEAEIAESTFVGNTASIAGGGVYNDDFLRLANNLIVGNTAPSDPDVYDVDHDDGGNLIGLPNGFTLGQVIQVDGSGHPVLADNGGPTRTVALAAGSPAIGNGTGSGTVDQRGVTRNAVRDTGAFETQPVTVTATATGGVANGSPFGVTDATVTGLSGTLATFGDLALVYRYYAGTLDAGQLASATPLAGAPTTAGDYTAVADYTAPGYRDGISPPVHFTITPAPVSPPPAPVSPPPAPPVSPPATSPPPQTAPITDDPTVPPVVVSPPTVPPVSPPTVPPTVPPVLVVTTPSSSPDGTQIKVFDPMTGQNTRTLVPFAGFFGAVDMATGDLNGDGIAEVVVGAGAGGGPRVRVFDGATGAELASFFAFGNGFTGGVDVAVGDVDGDGTPDLIVAAGPGGGPHVKVFDGKSYAEVRSFFAYAANFTGGVNVAVGDVDGDGKADIVTGAGASGGSHVKVFSGADLSVLYSFFAFKPAFNGGVNVAVGDVNGDGFADIIAGAGAGGSPQVAVFDGKDGSARGAFLAFDAGFAGGVKVGTTDVNGDGLADIVTAAGPGGGPHVKVFGGQSFDLLSSTFAFGEDLLGGVSVG